MATVGGTTFYTIRYTILFRYDESPPCPLEAMLVDLQMMRERWT